MPTWLRYMLFQTPQWLLLGIFIWFVRDTAAIPIWVAVGFFFLWVIKDLAFYPAVRHGYEKNARTGSERLVGSLGVACQRLDPAGYIKVHGELWRAQAEPGDKPIPRDSVVRIIRAEGLTLIVEQESDDRGTA